MSTDIYQDIILQNAVPQNTIQQDLLVYLQDAFDRIREAYNDRYGPGDVLPIDWPGNHILHNLVDIAIPLFIIAATIYRFVSDLEFDPRERLETFLAHKTTGQMEQIEKTYLPVLSHLIAKTRSDQENLKLCEEFRMIVGSIVCLAEPMSTAELSTLLQISASSIVRRLNPLHSVLQIPEDHFTPIRVLHLSFPEFLLSENLKGQPFATDGPNTHFALTQYCLRLLSGSEGLRKNLCDIDHPGQFRQDINSDMISDKFPTTLQYACQYWVYHLQNSQVQLEDNGDVHLFLQRHFLHWLEALSLMGRLSSAVKFLSVLESSSLKNSQRLLSFLEDARRFVLLNRHIADKAPLQLYSSCIIFAPQSSIIRTTCGHTPVWLLDHPTTSNTWSLELQQLQGHKDVVKQVAFSNDGTLIASASYDSTVRLWDATTGQELQTLEGHIDAVTAVAFSPDDTLLASASWNHTVRLWEVSTGAVVREMQGHHDWLEKAAFSLSKSALLASASADGPLQLWDVTTTEEVLKLEGDAQNVLFVAFSPSGTLLASSFNDGAVRLWDVTTGQQVHSLNDSGFAVAFSSDSSLLAYSSNSINGSVQILNLSDMQEIRKIVSDAFVISLAFSPDSTLLASASNTGEVWIWDVATGQLILRDDTTRACAVTFSPDGLTLALSKQDYTIRLWDVRYMKEEQRHEDYYGDIGAVVPSPDGTLLAVGSYNGLIRLYEMTTGKQLKILCAHSKVVNAMAFSADNSFFVSGSCDMTIRLWDVITGVEVLLLDGIPDVIVGVALSKDKTLLASASTEGAIRIFDITTQGQILHVLAGHNTGHIYMMAFSDDSSLLASTSNDNTVPLWNLTTGKEEHVLVGHTDFVYSIAFSSDCAILASTSGDRTVRLWDVLTGQEMQKFQDIRPSEKLEFISEDELLSTDSGLIDLYAKKGERVKSPFYNHDTIVVADEWIQCGGRNLFWLPPDFRGSRLIRGTSIVHGRHVAIVTSSGRVDFYEFGNFECLRTGSDDKSARITDVS